MTLQRHTYYSLIHHGIKTLLIDRVGHFTEREYHEYLDLTTGKLTCFAMSEQDLENTLDNLKSEGYLEDIKKLISRYQTMPTR